MEATAKITDELLKRTVLLQRVASALGQEVDAAMGDLRREVVLALVSGRGRPGDQVAELVGSAMQGLRLTLEESFRQVQQAQVEFVRRVFRDALERPVFFLDRISPPTRVMGAEYGEWFGKITDDLSLKVSSAARTLFATDAAPAIQRDFAASELTQTRTAVDALVRTSLQAMANEVTREVVSKSVDAKATGARWQQISILDQRTSAICREYAFKEWDAEYRPIGHKLPFNDGCPRHWNCRSVIVPVFGNSGPKAMTLASWMGTMGREQTNEVFGGRNVDLFERRMMPLSDLVRQVGRPVTVGEV